MSEENINISFHLHDNGTKVTLCLPPAIKILGIKRLLRKDLLLQGSHDILFSGHVLKDFETLKSYNFQDQTVLHVVKTKLLKSEENISKIPLLTGIWTHRMNNIGIIKPQLQIDLTDSIRTYNDPSSFYAFCKFSCVAVVPAKLRVRCKTCIEDAITVNQDPQGWYDVTRPGQITGHCQSQSCGGNPRVAEFYFRCALCNSKDGVIPLRNVKKNNSLDNVCLACLDYDSPAVVFPCQDDHLMCLTCFEQYARTNLRQRSMVLRKESGYSLPCPERCVNSCLRDTHVLHILGPDEYEVYQSYSAQACVLYGMNGTICPNPKCSTGLYPENESNSAKCHKITCTLCGYEFCSTCKEPYHGNTDCDTNLAAEAVDTIAVKDYFESIKTIKRIAKNCPRCKVPTERSGGCMHMTCNLCQYEWCWNCNTKWCRDCQRNHWFD